MKNYQKDTKKVYENLGLDYVNSIADLESPPEIYQFIEMLPNNSKVLEIGSGGGRDTKIIAENGKLKVIGIDFVDEFIKESQKRCPKAEFMKMDALDLKFKDQTFDGIWANAVLLHFNDSDLKKTVFKEINRVLKINGLLYTGVKIGEGESYVIDKLSGGHKRYFNFFTEKEFKKILNDFGFEILISHIGTDPAGRKDLKWIKIISKKFERDTNFRK